VSGAACGDLKHTCNNPMTPTWKGGATLAGVNRHAVKGFRDLLVWQRAMQLVVQCYRVTDRFPAAEKYSLTQQLRRAVLSVPSNIAEGHGREHLGDYLRHLSIANGSLMEVETQLEAGLRLGYVTSEGLSESLGLVEEIRRMLAGLTRALRARAGQLAPDT
jgi:four helix bundle protein